MNEVQFTDALVYTHYNADGSKRFIGLYYVLSFRPNV